MSINLFRYISLASVLLTFLCSCATTLPPHEREIDEKEHSVLIDQYGVPVDPKTGSPLAESEYREFVANIGARIRSYKNGVSICGESLELGEKQRIVIFVHGGLNTKATSLTSARRIGGMMVNSCVDPIFIRWNSSLWGSLKDHLFFLRNGKRSNSFTLAALTSPVTIASDIVRGVGRIPIDWSEEVAIQIPNIRKTNGRNYLLNCKVQGCTELSTTYGRIIAAIDTDSYARSFPGNAIRGLNSFATIPGSLLTAPFISSFGAPTWISMERRIDLLFKQRDDSIGETPLIHLLNTINENVNENTEIIIIGHSMGGIIANHILRSMPDLKFKDVVYLASASSVKQYERTIYPYLNNQTDSEVFHVVLDPDIERHERNYSFLSQGSLLVWIDRFFLRPRTRNDLTSGRYDNLFPALVTTPSKYTERVRLKVFSAGKHRYHPQYHGDFGNFPFWMREFYDPSMGFVMQRHTGPEKTMFSRYHLDRE